MNISAPNIKNVMDQIPFVLMLGVGGGLLLLSLYSMAAVSVAEHVKGRIQMRGRKLLQGLLKRESREVTYAHERTN